jgi:hypothetical protein
LSQSVIHSSLKLGNARPWIDAFRISTYAEIITIS